MQNSRLAQSAMWAAGIGIVSYGLVAVVAVPSILAGAGPRANFTLTWTHMAANGKVWLDLIMREWSFLVPLMAAAVCLGVSARRFSRAGAVLSALAWMAVWVGLFLPYRFTPGYYLLPFSLGASVLAGYLILQMADSIRTARPAAKVTGIGLAALSVGLFLLTLPNNLSNARIQLAVDQANTDMLQSVAHQAPSGARVLVNIREDIEYLWSIGPMLRLLYGRTDLQIEAYPPTDPISDRNGQSTWIVSPLIENVPWPSVRLGIPEVASREWEAGLHQDLGERLSLEREVRQSAQLLIVDAPRLLCLAARELSYCQRRNAPFDTRLFAAGWRIYFVKQDQE
ncbi:MAG TPA: hypothetical protein VFI11_00485 [Anaerolineales bacterium]|nr:hypothetical protein [Anaerolineales bacterium]